MPGVRKGVSWLREICENALSVYEVIDSPGYYTYGDGVLEIEDMYCR
jgi:hypothetical protein